MVVYLVIAAALFGVTYPLLCFYKLALADQPRKKNTSSFEELAESIALACLLWGPLLMALVLSTPVLLVGTVAWLGVKMHELFVEKKIDLGAKKLVAEIEAFSRQGETK